MRIIFFFINSLALTLFLSGHNAPGGGFIAGIATGISLVMLQLTMPSKALRSMMHFNPLSLAATGLILAYGTAMAPVFFGQAFLTHTMVHWHLPVLGDLHVGTPLLFDTGVYLVVVGVTAKILFAFTHSQESKRAALKQDEADYAQSSETPVVYKESHAKS